MAKIAKKVIWWASVPGAVNYVVRIIPDGNHFTYGPPAPGAQVSVPALEPPEPEQELNLSGLTLSEGVYDIYITAQDAAGNESDPLELADAVLDFTPPAAPSAGGFR